MHPHKTVYNEDMDDLAAVPERDSFFCVAVSIVDEVLARHAVRPVIREEAAIASLSRVA